MARRARRRDYKAEYARRISGYQQRHPGATRAAARGHQPSEYQARVARYRELHPGASRAQAAGHRSAADLPPAIRKAARQGGYVSFIGVDRQADGTWRRASFTVGDADGEREFLLGPRQLGKLAAIGGLIASSGVMLLGGKYLQAMIEWETKQ